MASPRRERFYVCSRCGHAKAAKKRRAVCPECGHSGCWEISGPDALRGMFATIDNVRAGRPV